MMDDDQYLTDMNFDQHFMEKLKAEEGERLKKSISKTVAFAAGGKSLARILFWQGGNEYNPDYTLHLKLETKKIRNVANADLTSFVKQSYLYEWLSGSICP